MSGTGLDRLLHPAMHNNPENEQILTGSPLKQLAETFSRIAVVPADSLCGDHERRDEAFQLVAKVLCRFLFFFLFALFEVGFVAAVSGPTAAFGRSAVRDFLHL